MELYNPDNGSDELTPPKIEEIKPPLNDVELTPCNSDSISDDMLSVLDGGGVVCEEAGVPLPVEAGAGVAAGAGVRPLMWLRYAAASKDVDTLETITPS